MNENEKIEGLNQEGQGTDPSDFDLLDEVKKIKENSVPKEEYEKERAKNKELMRRLVEGGGQEDKTDDTVDLNKIREDLFKNNAEGLSKREFWQKVLTLRHERLKNEGVDIFLPKGRKTRYTRLDIESANRLDETITQMIEDSEDNPALFDVLFNEALN